MIKTGTNARQICRAHALNLRHKGLTVAEVADFLEITPRTVYNIEGNYTEHGLARALYDDPRPGRPIELGDRFISYVVATVCSDPPEGFDRWTLQLVRERLLEHKLVEQVSLESIRLVLKEHDLKPWQQRSWCVSKLDACFIERMERLLALYALDRDEDYPVVCLDEKPIQLLDHVRPPSGLWPGKRGRVDYEYKRMGTCNVFCAVEPKRGAYQITVTRKRRGEDFARMLKQLSLIYPKAKKIRLVIDNLNTHGMKSLVDLYGKQAGQRLWSRFDVYYTPVHGSWLNQAEIAINMYARQCLGSSRIADIQTLRKKSRAWRRYINRKNVRIEWSFTTKDARDKFGYS